MVPLFWNLGYAIGHFYPSAIARMQYKPLSIPINPIVVAQCFDPLSATLFTPEEDCVCLWVSHIHIHVPLPLFFHSRPLSSWVREVYKYLISSAHVCNRRRPVESPGPRAEQSRAPKYFLECLLNFLKLRVTNLKKWCLFCFSVFSTCMQRARPPPQSSSKALKAFVMITDKV